MGSVKNPDLAIHHHRHATAFSLADLCTQFVKHGFNVAPLNVSACWSCKNQSKGALVFSLHAEMVLFFGTYIKAWLSIGPAVLVLKGPFAIHHDGLDVIVRVISLVFRTPITHFQIDDNFQCLVDQPMTVTTTRLEASTHTGRQAGVSRDLPFGMQRVTDSWKV